MKSLWQLVIVSLLRLTPTGAIAVKNGNLPTRLRKASVACAIASSNAIGYGGRRQRRGTEQGGQAGFYLFNPLFISSTNPPFFKSCINSQNMIPPNFFLRMKFVFSLMDR